MASETAPIATLDEMRALLNLLPSADLEAGSAVSTRDRTLTKPAGALGRLEDIAVWMAEWQGKYPPNLRHPRTVVFAGNHGVTIHGVSAYPQAVTAQMVENFIAGGAAVNQLCALVDADLRVYEMGLDQPTADFTEAPAMDEAECARAIAYGMMAVEPGIDILSVGEMGIGNTTSAAALCLALFGGSGTDWVGPGTGVDQQTIAMKATLIERAVARHKDAMLDPFTVLQHLGGLELAAIVGAILAARMGRVPVMLDGFAATAAAAILYAADKRALDHCLVGHCSAEPAHRRLLDLIGKRPLLDLGMRLGEGSGATLAVCLVKAALDCHNNMATFAEAKVSTKAV